MTTDEVLAELSRRGVVVVRNPDGTLAVRHYGHPERVTPALLAVLRWHRGDLARRLSARLRDVSKEVTT